MAKRPLWQVWAGEVYHRVFRQMLGVPEIPRRRLRAFLRSVAARPLSTSAAMRLAVVVPCYGHERYLAATFDSLCRQTRLPDEVMVVNDASPDQSLRWLKETGIPRLRACIPHVMLIDHASNVGQARSINEAVASSSASLVMILNDDDYLFHDAIELIMGLFQRHPETALWGGEAIAFTSDEVVRSYVTTAARTIDPANAAVEIRPPSAVLRYRRFNDYNIAHSSSTFRREAWAAAGGYHGEAERRLFRYADRDFQLRVHALYPAGLVQSGQPLVFWRSDSSVDKELFS